MSARSTSEKTAPSVSSRAPFRSSIAVRTSPSCMRAQASPARARTSSSTEFVAGDGGARLLVDAAIASL